MRRTNRGVVCRQAGVCRTVVCRYGKGNRVQTNQVNRPVEMWYGSVRYAERGAGSEPMVAAREGVQEPEMLREVAVWGSGREPQPQQQKVGVVGYVGR